MYPFNDHAKLFIIFLFILVSCNSKKNDIQNKKVISETNNVEVKRDVLSNLRIDEITDSASYFLKISKDSNAINIRYKQ